MPDDWHEVKPTKSINPYAFAEFLAAAPPEALALANITTSLAEACTKMKNADVSQEMPQVPQDEPLVSTLVYAGVTSFAPITISDGPLKVWTEKTTMEYKHEWNKAENTQVNAHLLPWEKDDTPLYTSKKHWALEGVVGMQQPNAQKEYYFLTKELEEWLRTPNKPRREATLKAILD